MPIGTQINSCATLLLYAKCESLSLRLLFVFKTIVARSYPIIDRPISNKSPVVKPDTLMHGFP
jgi:hypothetical protein